MWGGVVPRGCRVRTWRQVILGASPLKYSQDAQSARCVRALASRNWRSDMGGDVRAGRVTWQLIGARAARLPPSSS